MHYLISGVADSFERQSNYIEIENMSEILRKLIKKVEKIRLNLFDLIKASIAEMMETDEDKFKSKEKIKSKNSTIN